MFSKEELKRYNRQIILSEIGIEGQQKLKAAKVLVIGTGGLGCPVLQYLVAAGVGTIGIVDHDTVDESNLHRQILFSATDAGKSKAETAAQKLNILNPFVSITPYNTSINSSNSKDLIKNYDLVVDGSDNFETRYLVNDACVELNKPLVFGSIFGFEGQISVFNYKGGPTYRCVFPEAGEAPNCAVNGVLGVLPGIIGSYMANEALKIILGIGEPLSGRLMVLNVLENTTNLFKIKRVVSESGQPPQEREHHQAETGDEIAFAEMEQLLLDKPDKVYLIDVREPIEFEADNVGGVNIPLSELPEELPDLPAQKHLLFYCNSGKRSKAASEIIKQSLPGVKVSWIKRS